jgi:hypothetical protein
MYALAFSIEDMSTVSFPFNPAFAERMNLQLYALYQYSQVVTISFTTFNSGLSYI